MSPTGTIETLYETATHYTHWAPKLHALQAVQFLNFARIDRAKVRGALPVLSDDNKVLVKVWALDADVRLNIENESQLNRLRQKLNMALEAGPASLTARARQLKEEYKALD